MRVKNVEELLAVLRTFAQEMRNGYAEYGDRDNINGLLGMATICDGAADRIEDLQRRLNRQEETP